MSQNTKSQRHLLVVCFTSGILARHLKQRPLFACSRFVGVEAPDTDAESGTIGDCTWEPGAELETTASEEDTTSMSVDSESTDAICGFFDGCCFCPEEVVAAFMAAATAVAIAAGDSVSEDTLWSPATAASIEEGPGEATPVVSGWSST